MGNEKIRAVMPTDFRLRLSNVGTDTFNGSYKMMTDTNALRLADRAIRIISESFVGKEKIAQFQYAIACYLLSGLNYPKEELDNHINKIVKGMKDGAWELKKKPEVKP